MDVGKGTERSTPNLKDLHRAIALAHPDLSPPFYFQLAGSPESMGATLS